MLTKGPQKHTQLENIYIKELSKYISSRFLILEFSVQPSPPNMIQCENWWETIYSTPPPPPPPPLPTLTGPPCARDEILWHKSPNFQIRQKHIRWTLLSKAVNLPQNHGRLTSDYVARVTFSKCAGMTMVDYHRHDFRTVAFADLISQSRVGGRMPPRASPTLSNGEDNVSVCIVL